jgi:small subunit ribosomal protein S8
MVQDHLANALSHIKNCEARRKLECVVTPASKMVMGVLEVMQKNGYIKDLEYIDDGRFGKIKVRLTGGINDCGAIKPRFSVRVKEMENFEKRFLPAIDVGILIISTPKGIMAHKEAKKRGVGGKLIAYVF